MEQLVWINRLYYGKDYKENLSEEEKDLIRNFLRYNYNILSSEESAEETLPQINDFNGIDKSCSDIIHNKIQEEEEELGSLIE
jgi:hypothetical protein